MATRKSSNDADNRPGQLAPEGTRVTGESTALRVSDVRRRRLVRGAAVLAPAILTLRSGSLAAASCTGAIKIDAGNQLDVSPTDYLLVNVIDCNDIGAPTKWRAGPGGATKTKVADSCDPIYDDNGNITGYTCTGPAVVTSMSAAGSIAPG